MSLLTAFAFFSLALIGSCIGQQYIKVNITVYDETLCSGCSEWFSEEFDPLVAAPGVLDIIGTFDVVPFGFSYYEVPLCPSKTPGQWNSDTCGCWMKSCQVPNKTVVPPPSCFKSQLVLAQHGPQEHLGDRISGCVLELYPMSRALKFVRCFIGDYKGNITWAPHCAEQCRINFQAISSCTHTLRGDTIELSNAIQTLQAMISYTPWVEVNGVHTELSLLHAVCDAYQGPKPKGCSEVLV